MRRGGLVSNWFLTCESKLLCKQLPGFNAHEVANVHRFVSETSVGVVGHEEDARNLFLRRCLFCQLKSMSNAVGGHLQAISICVTVIKIYLRFPNFQ